ncbi:MAG TPA: radical SAM family heme chaperone HemW [Acidobacteriaceae bacterium]|nr:radical SAM family heme chaperone HemW [Acidobacteriaceae bacterium]
MTTQPPPMQNLASTLGVYVSIPFCRAKCSYCNFASGVYGADRMAAYVEKLTAQIRQSSECMAAWGSYPPTKVDSLYLGGGTPSLLNINQLDNIVKGIRDVFSIGDFAEMTLECAPGQMAEELLHAMPGLGLNRVSLGVQSFMDHEAAAVGRTHTRAITLNDIDRLRAAGIDNINVDLIAGLPHQTRQSWRESLVQAIATGVPHLSVYMLDVDEDSSLGREIIAGGTRYGVGVVPNEQTIAEMYTEAIEQFGAAGMPQYEISNFARAGQRSRHNLKYWTRQPYLGFGLDAHSFLPTAQGEAIRVAATDDLTAYLDPNIADCDREAITPVSAREALEEAWFLGLRLNGGVSIAEITREFGASAIHAYQPVLEEAQQQGLIEYDDRRARLTHHGRLFANDVFQRFLGVVQSDDVATSLNHEQGVFA